MNILNQNMYNWLNAKPLRALNVKDRDKMTKQQQQNKFKISSEK